jgi:hypothetical protein
VNFENPVDSTAVEVKEPWQGLFLLYDEETEAVAALEQDVVLASNAGMVASPSFQGEITDVLPLSTYEHVYCYAVYGNGKLYDAAWGKLDAGIIAAKGAEKVSKTANAALRVVEDPNPLPKRHGATPPSEASPLPAPAPQPSAPVADEGTQAVGSSGAAALREEAERLMAEAKRLEAEAAMTDGAARPTA